MLNSKRIMFDIKLIKNSWALNAKSHMRDVMDVICEYNNFDVNQKVINDNSILYMLRDTSYIILQSFPEECYLSVDIHKYGEYVKEEYDCIFDFLVQAFDANPLWSLMREF